METQTKRNWQVRVDGAAEFFDTKDAAKVFRNAHPEHGVKVSKGPDHPRLGDRGNPRTHSHKQGESKGDGFKRVRRNRRS